MSDRAPPVDFSTPYSELGALRAQQQMLRSVSDDIRGSLRDLDRIQSEAMHDAAMAAVWAATLMVCDILKIGLSAADRRAKLLFSAQDRAVRSADRILKLLGAGGLATKADLMKSVSAELGPAAQATEDVRKAMSELRNLKLPTTGQPVPVKIPKEAGLLVDLGVAMAQDTILLMQAGHLQRQASVNAAQGRAQMKQSLMRVQNKITLIDSEITRAVERLEREARTA